MRSSPWFALVVVALSTSGCESKEELREADREFARRTSGESDTWTVHGRALTLSRVEHKGRRALKVVDADRTLILVRVPSSDDVVVFEAPVVRFGENALEAGAEPGDYKVNDAPVALAAGTEAVFVNGVREGP